MRPFFLSLNAMLLGVFMASPLSAQCFEQQLLAGDPEALDAFGWGMDIEGDLMAVGAIGGDDACIGNPNCNSGAVYVFRRIAGVWTQEAKLTASDAEIDDEFGQDVAISGDRILIGAHKREEGAAYVFLHDGNSWVEEQKLVGSGLSNNFHFGHSVSLDGDVALIGTMRDNTQGDETGAAFVFVRIGGVWVEQAKLLASDAAAGDRYGRSCDLQGDYIAIGGHLHDGVGADSGSAYVYERDDNGTPGDLSDDTWPEAAVLVPGDIVPGMKFGRCVDFTGDILIVGAEFGEDGGVATGAAYIYFRNGAGNWIQVQKLLPSNGADGDQFGISVALDGEYALIGSRSADEAGAASGAIYVFSRTPGGYFETAILTGPDSAPGDRLGDETGVQISGVTAAFTSRFSAAAANVGGTAYLFQLNDCLGTNYCDLSPNSAGPGASIRTAGLASISQNDFTLISTDAIPNKVGLFFYGPNQINVPLGDGRLCVGGVVRLNPPVVTDGSGTATRVVDLTTAPAGAGPNQITAGSTWNFQHWLRDPDAMGSGFTLSNGVEVSFIP